MDNTPQIRSVCAIIRTPAYPLNLILGVTRIHDGRTVWTLPGGKIENGESPEEAIHREVMEEVGLRVLALEVIYTGQCIGEDWLCRAFLCSTDSALPSTTESHAIGYIHPLSLGGPFKSYYADLDRATRVFRGDYDLIDVWDANPETPIL